MSEAKEPTRYLWNCPGHPNYDDECKDCRTISREMQPSYCVVCCNDKSELKTDLASLRAWSVRAREEMQRLRRSCLHSIRCESCKMIEDLLADTVAATESAESKALERMVKTARVLLESTEDEMSDLPEWQEFSKALIAYDAEQVLAIIASFDRARGAGAYWLRASRKLLK